MSKTQDMSSEKATTVKISGKTKVRLAAHGVFGESYEDVIIHILDEIDALKTSSKESSDDPIKAPATA